MPFQASSLRTVRVLALALAGSFAAAQAGAQSAATSELYQSFGEQAGLLALSTDLVDRVSSDPRIAGFFEKTNRAALAKQLADQFCQVLGGPCRYAGVDMKTVHQEMGISKADFHALVEDLQAAMAARHIPFSVQNQLLARLAPMHRDIIETP